MNAPERKPLRQKRVDVPIRVVQLKRAITTAQKVGLSVSAIEVRPDGTILLSTGGLGTATPPPPTDIFAEWADRL